MLLSPQLLYGRVGQANSLFDHRPDLLPRMLRVLTGVTSLINLRCNGLFLIPELASPKRISGIIKVCVRRAIACRFSLHLYILS